MLMFKKLKTAMNCHASRLPIYIRILLKHGRCGSAELGFRLISENVRKLKGGKNFSLNNFH
ncbi:MAG: hypothetical protein CVV24_00365 [Ignavibacteriae bacterium HGW-Ignavibacteriae-3]|nr:MAG: hypothetical protein CVV24_00365 [Ignavibacteriae bacterium HGW-Ignavibacteriae-3]